ncbi:B3 domain-containing protein At2g33720-like [Durio zibethinus]|uniref:B3 domain-containing protein At2g33720-like n=1 Tax=Durio zibethinus TaxID=66656 RepID=A0A6P5Y6T2_DURZI|nr:B3 domain-containing protein At2g33720-like [Durio zibethinus]
MDYKPFTASGLFSPAKDRPKEENPGCEESNISLELSLSLGYSSTAATDKGKQEIYYEGNCEVGESHYSNDEYQRKEYKMNNFVEKKSEGVSLELSLSGDYIWESKEKSPATDKGNQKSFEASECSNQYQREEHNLNHLLKLNVGGPCLQLNMGFDDACSSKKRERMENPSSTRIVSSCRNKRTKIEREESCKAVVTELRLGHDPWCIKKQLYESDLGNMSRLLLALELVESHIFPFWNADQLKKIKQGLPVSVWDCDTKTEHEMVFKQGNKGANVLIKNWVKDFVKRRELKLGDEIGLYWDSCSSRLKFSVLNRAATH